MHLMLVIEVMRNGTANWKELLFAKIGAKFCSLDLSMPAAARNEVLMQKWLLPKLARTLNLNHAAEPEELCVTVTEEETVKDAVFNRVSKSLQNVTPK